jgi:hypothetical protein
MALPWLAALSVIPWRTILENAPALARSAEALLSRTAAPRASADSSADAHRLLIERVAALERRDRETAELLTRVTDQLAAVTTATQVLEARTRWFSILAVASLLVAIGATGLVGWIALRSPVP